MMMKLRFFLTGLLALSFGTVTAQRSDTLRHMEWRMQDSLREALVYAPERAKHEPSPLVFVFHGRGGKMEGVANNFRIHELWPEAIVVYPQGLWVPRTGIVGAGTGWQRATKNDPGRDVAFFDAMLETLREAYVVDEDRIYATGQSNGGGFTHTLWATRGELLAAVAPANSAGSRANPFYTSERTPKPAFIVAGEADPLVNYEWSLRLIEDIRQLNGCGEGQRISRFLTRYEAPDGNDVETFLHTGGHAIPPQALRPLVDFLKAHPRR